MSERLRLMGHLEELKLQAEQLRGEIEDTRDIMRELLYPHEPVETIDGRKLAYQTARIVSALELYRPLLHKIAEVKKDLGQ